MPRHYPVSNARTNQRGGQRNIRTSAVPQRVDTAAEIRLDLRRLVLLLLFDLEEKRAVDVREHTTERDGDTDQGVELFVTTDGELEMAGSYALHLQVLGGVLKKLSLAKLNRADGRAGL